MSGSTRSAPRSANVLPETYYAPDPKSPASPSKLDAHIDDFKSNLRAMKTGFQNRIGNINTARALAYGAGTTVVGLRTARAVKGTPGGSYAKAALSGMANVAAIESFVRPKTVRSPRLAAYLGYSTLQAARQFSKLRKQPLDRKTVPVPVTVRTPTAAATSRKKDHKNLFATIATFAFGQMSRKVVAALQNRGAKA